MKFHPFINGLRAVAVVPVILFHFSTGVFPGGYAGVDVFFVISGFLITGVLMGMLEKRNFSLLDFYERRARRILPALFVMCGLCLAFCAVYFMPEDFKLFGRSLLGAALFGTNFTFLEDVGYFASPALVKPLLHTWSLAVEEQFYIFYPLMLLGLYKWAGKDKKKITAGVCTVFAVSLVLNLVLISRCPDGTFYLLPGRAWELLAGALVFLQLQNLKLAKAKAEIAGIAGFALLLFAYTFYDRTTVFPGAAAMAPVFGTVLILWANLHTQTLTGRLLSYKPVIGVGLVSYGLYLYHWPLLVFARYYLERDLTGIETAEALLLVTAVSAASYVLVEQPIRERKVFVTRQTVLSAAVAGLLVTGIIGVAGTKTDGFPHRFSGPVLQYVTDDKAPTETCVFSGADKQRAQLCKMGIEGKRADFVLWGDSHSDKISPGLDAIAREKHLTGWKAWSPGCLPLLNVDRIGSDKYQCAAVNDRTLAFIRDSKVRTVILVGRWDSIFPPEAASMEALRNTTGPRVKLHTKDDRDLYDIDALNEGLKETIDALEALGAQVWIVKQVPAHLAYLSSALAKDAYLGRDTTDLQRPLTEVLTRRAPIDAVFDRLHDPAVTFIDPVKKFCADGKYCAVEADGRALYKDDTHLTVYGAMWAKDIWRVVFSR